MESTIKVIGIDPAPAKETVIYDGEKFIEVLPVELKVYLENFKEDTLICWDAPLTGMASENAIRNFQQYLEALAKSKKKKKPKWSPLEARIIEKYIALQDIPKAISTNSFSQCPHWAITQYCLGLPLINDQFIQKEPIPFELITSHNEREKLSLKKNYIVEVHPALALWLWLKDSGVENWNYKGSSRKDKNILGDNQPENKTKIFKTLTELLFKKAELLLGKQQAFDISKIKVTVIKSKEETVEEKTMTDDHLDAYIAWLLGTLWLKNEVILAGNKNTGAMLLPKEVSEDWQIELDKYK